MCKFKKTTLALFIASLHAIRLLEAAPKEIFFRLPNKKQTTHNFIEVGYEYYSYTTIEFSINNRLCLHSFAIKLGHPE